MKRFLCVVLAVFMILAAGCSSGSNDSGGGETGYRDTLVFCQGNDLTTLDGSIGLQERAVSLTNHIFDPLFVVNLDYEVVGSLAESYEWQDDVSLAVKLREGVKFHDGSDMTAEDVKYTMDLIDERGSIFVGNYAGCEIVDDYNIIIRTNDPNPALPNVLSMPQTCILPSDAYDPDSFAVNPIGTGPYKMKEFKEGDYYTLERFDDYWGQPAKTQYLTLRIVPEPSQRTILLETGEVDVAYNIPINDIKRIEGDPNLKILTCPSMKVILMDLNCESDGPVGNAKVRRAIECAIDKESIISSLLEGYGEAVDGIVSPHAKDYRETTANAYDPQLAESLMKEAGFADGFEISLFTNSDQINGEIAQVLQSQLSKVGITLKITIQDDNTTFSMVENGQDYDMILDFFQTSSAHANDVFNNMLYSTSFNNYSRYYSDEFDQTYVQYASTAEGPEREALLDKLYELIQRDTPGIGLYLENKIVAATSGVDGIIMSCIGAHEFQEATVKAE